MRDEAFDKPWAPPTRSHLGPGRSQRQPEADTGLNACRRLLNDCFQWH